MNEKDLIHEMAEDLGSVKTAKKALESPIKQICTSLADDDPVLLSGFGTFRTSLRKARKGRNLQTGDVLEIAAKRVVRFSPNKVLKNAVG